MTASEFTCAPICTRLPRMPRRDFTGRPSCWNPDTTRGLGFMATQTVAFPADHRGLGEPEVVRQSFIAHHSSDGTQRRNKLRTNHDCLHDSKRIIGICAPVKIVLAANYYSPKGAWNAEDPAKSEW